MVSKILECDVCNITFKVSVKNSDVKKEDLRWCVCCGSPLFESYDEEEDDDE